MGRSTTVRGKTRWSFDGQANEFDVLAGEGVVDFLELGAVLVVPAVAVATDPVSGGVARIHDILRWVETLADSANPLKDKHIITHSYSSFSPVCFKGDCSNHSKNLFVNRPKMDLIPSVLL
jgi:hypothetical protein